MAPKNTPAGERRDDRAGQSLAPPGSLVPRVLLELRAATAEAHKLLERRLPLASPELSQASYTNTLCAYYGFYLPLERRLHPIAQVIAGLDWPRRRKADLLALDLVRLGLDRQAIESVPDCRRLPAVTGGGDVLGCLYVLEGATLGGQILRKLVRERLGLGPASGAAFLGAYGASTGTMWRHFISCLGMAEEPALRRQVVAAAVATFSSLQSWLESCGVLRWPERKPLRAT
jgi:heme oxygenase (biliverdin-IX-beta and delta-forming)